MPSFISIRPTVWPQCTNVTGRQDRQRTDSIGRTVLQTVSQKPHIRADCHIRRALRDDMAKRDPCLSSIYVSTIDYANHLRGSTNIKKLQRVQNTVFRGELFAFRTKYSPSVSLLICSCYCTWEIDLYRGHFSPRTFPLDDTAGISPHRF